MARQISELLLERGRRWQALVSHDPIAGVLFDTVLTASIAHLPLRDAVSGRWVTLEDTTRLGRPVSAMAVAQSMGISHTTIRRRAAELVAAGKLSRDTAGLRVGPWYLTDGARADMSSDYAVRLGRALAALAEAGYMPAAHAIAMGVVDLPPGVLDRSFIAFGLRVSETTTRYYGDIVATMTFSAIVAANIRHITADLALARLYAGEGSVPPDGERRPIGVRALAAAIGLPFETVRRRVGAMIAAGLVERRAGGVIVPARVLSHARHSDHNRQLVAWFDQMLEALTRAVRDGSRMSSRTAPRPTPHPVASSPPG